MKQLTKRLVETAAGAELTEHLGYERGDRAGWAMSARGLTPGEIQVHLGEIYGVPVSKDLISRVTDGVLDDIRSWQNRPLDPWHPIVWLDALVVKIRTSGVVQNRANDTRSNAWPRTVAAK